MKKSKLDILIAVGKPKSRNPNGVASNSIADPDQGGSAMNPQAEDESAMNADTPEGEAQMMEETSGGMQEEPVENCLTLPPGFEAPTGSEDGRDFTTTVTGHLQDGKFYATKFGDMPLEESEQEEKAVEDVEDQDSEEEYPGADEMKKKRSDEMTARKVFQSGRY